MNEREFVQQLLNTGSRLSISLLDGSKLPYSFRVHITCSPKEAVDYDKNDNVIKEEMAKVAKLLRDYLNSEPND